MIFTKMPKLLGFFKFIFQNWFVERRFVLSAVPSGDKLEKGCGGCRRKRRGAAAVEFAIVAPVFVLMILGMIEFGRAIMVQQVLTNAAREGARVAVLDGSTSTGINSTINSYLQSAGITGATIDLNPDEPATAGYGQPVTVKISIPFSNVSWLPAPWFLSGQQLMAISVMRRETVE